MAEYVSITATQPAARYRPAPTKAERRHGETPARAGRPPRPRHEAQRANARRAALGLLAQQPIQLRDQLDNALHRHERDSPLLGDALEHAVRIPVLDRKSGV